MKLLVEEPAASRLGLLKTDPSLGLLAPALGRAGGGVAVQAVANTRNGEPVTRPTALKIPQQVPLTQDGGAVWGIAVGCTGSSSSDRTPKGPSNAAGVTAQQARRLPRAARPRSRGPAAEATDVPPSEATGAAVEPARTDFPRSGGPAPGVAGGRGDDLARAQLTGAERSATQWSAAQCASSGPVRQAGPSVAYPRRTSGPAIPGHGKGRLRHPAGAAGLAVLREGWKPVRVETRSAARRLDAQHDSPTLRAAGTRPSATREALQLAQPLDSHRQPCGCQPTSASRQQDVSNTTCCPGSAGTCACRRSRTRSSLRPSDAAPFCSARTRRTTGRRLRASSPPSRGRTSGTSGPTARRRRSPY